MGNNASNIINEADGVLGEYNNQLDKCQNDIPKLHKLNEQYINKLSDMINKLDSLNENDKDKIKDIIDKKFELIDTKELLEKINQENYNKIITYNNFINKINKIFVESINNSTEKLQKRIKTQNK